MKLKTFIFLSILLMGLLYSCKPKDTIQEESLNGRWNIIKAIRNGQETPYLRGGYVVINNDGQIVVNISGEEERGAYTLANNIIKTDQNKEFKLSSVRGDSMTIEFIPGPQSEFVFYMVRQHDTPQ